jgi:hypothetical protein
MCDSRIKRALCFALVALLLCAGFFLTPQPAKAEDNDGLFRIRVMVVWEGGPKPDVQVQLTHKEVGGPELNYGGPVTLSPTSPTYVWEIPWPETATTFNVNQVSTAPGYQYPIKSYDSTTKTWIITNKFINKQDVTATLYWEGGPDTKPGVSLQLYAGTQKVRAAQASEPVLISAPGEEPKRWQASATLADMPIYDSNDNPIQYWSEPIGVPLKYELKMPDPQDLESTLVFIPTYKEVYVTKIWIGGPESKPGASLHLQLKSNAVIVRQYDRILSDPVEITAEGDTVRTWEEQYTFRADVSNLSSYYFTLIEDKIGDYSSIISGNWINGFTITNTYAIPKQSITVSKVWDDNFETHPNVRIQLFRNGEAFGEEVELSEGENTYTWGDVEMTDENGVPYVFTVDEVRTPQNYVKTVAGSVENGFVITNRYVPVYVPPIVIQTPVPEETPFEPEEEIPLAPPDEIPAVPEEPFDPEEIPLAVPETADNNSFGLIVAISVAFAAMMLGVAAYLPNRQRRKAK